MFILIIFKIGFFNIEDFFKLLDFFMFIFLRLIFGMDFLLVEVRLIEFNFVDELIFIELIVVFFDWIVLIFFWFCIFCNDVDFLSR